MIPMSEEQKLKEKNAKALLWLGIVSMIMAFAGLTSAFIVRKAEKDWVAFELPQMFWLSTALLIISSVTMYWASLSAKTGSLKKLNIALLITLLLGLGFTYCQFLGWGQLYAQGIVFGGKYSKASGSFIYFLSALHLAHLIGGIIALLITLFKALKGKYSKENYLGVKLSAIYWHFLDILWLYLFLFLYFVK